MLKIDNQQIWIYSLYRYDDSAYFYSFQKLPEGKLKEVCSLYTEFHNNYCSNMPCSFENDEAEDEWFKNNPFQDIFEFLKKHQIELFRLNCEESAYSPC